MSKFTTEVRFICETAAGLKKSEGYNSVNEILQKATPIIFNFDYPIFDELYRTALNTKILRHYYTREIGLETVGLWKLKLETKMTEIMPYYNQLYKSSLIEFNPLYNVDHSRTYNRKQDGTQNSTGSAIDRGTTTNSQNVSRETTGKSITDGTNETTTNTTVDAVKNNKDAYSDTPQGSLAGVEQNKYLTNYRKIDENDIQTTDSKVDGSMGSTVTDTGSATDSLMGSTSLNNTQNTNANSVINNLEEYVEIIKGKEGGASFSALLQEFRETMLNIDMMIIEELSELFFMLWE